MSANLVVLGSDEDLALRALGAALGRNGHTVRWFADPALAVGFVRDVRPDLLVVDLPHAGFDPCRSLLGPSGELLVPVLVLTAPGDDVSRVVAFELGVDDAVSRPWSEAELVLRVRAILRGRGGTASSRGDRPGGLVLDPRTGQLRAHGRPLVLSALETRLLTHLLTLQGAMAARDDLARSAWGALPRDPRAVDTAVKRLRQKLVGTGVEVRTVRGSGFRLEVGSAE